MLKDAINSDSYASLLKKLESGDISEVQKEIFISPRPKEEFYELNEDLFQRTNLIDDEKYQKNINSLRMILNQWKDETGDSQPDQITKDWFEKRPGPKGKEAKTKKDLPVGGQYNLTTSFYQKRGELPGASKNATKINNKGPF